jgi:hypothetical protein
MLESVFLEAGLADIVDCRGSEGRIGRKREREREREREGNLAISYWDSQSYKLQSCSVAFINVASTFSRKLRRRALFLPRFAYPLCDISGSNQRK